MAQETRQLDKRRADSAVIASFRSRLKMQRAGSELLDKAKRVFGARIIAHLRFAAPRGRIRGSFRSQRGLIPVRKVREYEAMKGLRNAGLNVESPGTGLIRRDHPVASRRAAIDRLKQIISQDEASVGLLTGESGTGKTWLWHQLVRELPASWRSISLEMSPSLDALEFLRLVNHGLGLPAGARLGTARLKLARVLQDEASEDRRWLLVIENADSTPDVVWAEVRSLVHAMEASAGFNALILVGQTGLANQLSMRSLSFLGTRITTHVHLLSMDLDESLELLQIQANRTDLTRSAVEELHRDARGNPRKLIQLLATTVPARANLALSGQPSQPQGEPRPMYGQQLVRSSAVDQPLGGAIRPAHQELAGAATASEEAREDPAAPGTTSLIPSRPPLRVEEGLIEVGWAGNLESEEHVTNVLPADDVAPAAAALAASSPPVVAAEPDEQDLVSEEIIEDHYAALQAWTEWAKNRGRAGGLSGGAGQVQREPTEPAEGTPANLDEASQDTETGGVSAVSGLRAEPQHDHAPYSQLFSRMRQSR